MYVQSDTLNIYLEFQLKHIETTSTTTAEDLFPVTSRDQLVLVLLIYKPSINCGLPPAPIGVPPQEIPNGTALSVTWYPLNLLVNRDFDYSNDNVGIYIMIIIYIYLYYHALSRNPIFRHSYMFFTLMVKVEAMTPPWLGPHAFLLPANVSWSTSPHDFY